MKEMTEQGMDCHRPLLELNELYEGLEAARIHAYRLQRPQVQR
jgi:hypothetical protein